LSPAVCAAEHPAIVTKATIMSSMSISGQQRWTGVAIMEAVYRVGDEAGKPVDEAGFRGQLCLPSFPRQAGIQ
jgi:hypothetical protein